MTKLTLTVPVQEWTLDQFDREVRGFRAMLVAYGDVFKAEAAPVQPASVVVQPVAKPVAETVVLKPRVSRKVRRKVFARGFSGQVIQNVLKLQPGEAAFIPHDKPAKAQVQALTAVQAFRKLMKKELRIRTSVVTAGSNTGVQVRRVV